MTLDVICVLSSRSKSNLLSLQCKCVLHFKKFRSFDLRKQSQAGFPHQQIAFQTNFFTDIVRDILTSMFIC